MQEGLFALKLFFEFLALGNILQYQPDFICNRSTNLCLLYMSDKILKGLTKG